MGMSSIEYIHHADINNQQWDRCIKSSFNGSVEAYSWYLNLFCDQWDALVEGDYKTVMPLPVKKKMGQVIVYMPPLMNQLGIYSPEQLTDTKISAFLMILNKRFRVINMGINKYTPVPGGIFPLHRQTYYELDLIRPYMKTVGDYSWECRNKLHLASAKRYSINRGISPNDVISLLKLRKIKIDSKIREKNYKLLRMLIASLVRYKACELYGAYNNVNMLASIALFVWSHTGVILLFAATTEEAIRDNAHLLLYDRFIEKYSETNITLNFQYTDAHHTSNLYNGFGAAESHFQRIRMNHLPFYLKPFFR
jgi:hypothetical protein